MNKIFLERFIKFLIVGGAGTAINYAAFWILYRKADWNYLIASITGYLIGLVLAYIFNKKWTYSVSSEQKNIFIHKYLLVYLFSLGASTLFLKFLVEYVQINPLFSNIFAIGLATILNFLGTNFLVFRNR